MIAHISIREKGFGDKLLYKELDIRVQKGEKIGLIGRNGTGKSTLFNIVSGLDTDYDGAIALSKNTVLISSRQEHHGYEGKIILEYILDDLPEYSKLKHVIETYPEHMGDSTHKLQVYSDALERFMELGYYEVESDVERALSEYQVDIDVAHTKLGTLSGGQKRMVELVKVQRARADIALIDEPTNHMDYIAKESFISWLRPTKEAVMVITHDRDVLGVVDRIIEIRDGKAYSFKGNYQQYLKSNTENVRLGHERQLERAHEFKHGDGGFTSSADDDGTALLQPHQQTASQVASLALQAQKAAENSLHTAPPTTPIAAQPDPTQVVPMSASNNQPQPVNTTTNNDSKSPLPIGPLVIFTIGILLIVFWLINNL